MPYFNSETGAMDPDSPDLVTGAPARHAELDRQQQEDRARREAIGTGKKPGEATRDGARPEGSRDTAQFGREEHERIRVAALADPTHPLNDPRHHTHEATVEQYLRLGEMADGGDYDDPEQNPEIGTLHDGKILRPEDNPEVRVNELSEAAQDAGFAWDPELLEELVAATDESGLPRHHVEQVFQSVAEAAEALAQDEDLDTVEAGLEGLLRTEGSGRARAIIADAQALIDRLAESGVPAFVRAADDLASVSNHPSVLRACAQLYGELKNLPPQGPWEQLLLGGASKWAQQQSAAQARAEKNATVDHAPDDHIVVRHGRP